MSISGKMSTGMRRASPMPSRAMRISSAATVWGRRRTYRTSDMVWRPSGLRRGGVGQGLAYAERAALAGRAQDFDLGAVGRADRLDDGEPESRAALLARARDIDTVEALEHVRQCLGRDADAVVGDIENREVAFAPHRQAYLAPARGVLDGVVEQIDDHLLQARPVALHRHRGAGITDDADVFVGGEQAHLLRRGRRELREVESQPLRVRLAGVQAR